MASSLLIFPKLLIAVVGAKAPPPLSQPDQHDEVRYYVREVEQCGGQRATTDWMVARCLIV